MASLSTNKLYLFTPAQGIKQFNVTKYFLQNSLMWGLYSTAETRKKACTAKPPTDSSVTFIRSKASPLLHCQKLCFLVRLLFQQATPDVLSRKKFLLFQESSFQDWARKQSPKGRWTWTWIITSQTRAKCSYPESKTLTKTVKGRLGARRVTWVFGVNQQEMGHCTPQLLCLQCISAPMLQHGQSKTYPA